MNDYFLRILARQRHDEILNACNAGRQLQLKLSRVCRGTWVTNKFRHLFGQWRRPIACLPKVADERNNI